LLVDDLALQKVLVWLGFSELQAKTYLALLEMDKASVEALSKQLGVSRLDVCRVLCGLEELGLVEGFVFSVGGGVGG
jgi:sugar-specific transcriptional regulator TrmB